MSDQGSNRNLALAGSALFVVVIAMTLGIIYVNSANGGDRQAVVNTPTPTAVASAVTSPTASPAATATPSASATAATSTIPYANCAAASFGPALAPLNPPQKPHVYPAAPAMTINTNKLYEATITTKKGTMVLCLQPDLAPKTVNNFVTLARNHFYDGLTFHRVVAGFVIQGGDPQGNGNGGPGYQFADEPVRQAYVVGAVAMANSGANTNGSQFFIDIADDTSQLTPSYNLFGKLVSGQDVADKIAVGDVMTKVTVTEQK